MVGCSPQLKQLIYFVLCMQNVFSLPTSMTSNSAGISLSLSTGDLQSQPPFDLNRQSQLRIEFESPLHLSWD